MSGPNVGSTFIPIIVSVPPFIIFGDRSLKDMALVKPLSREEFADVFGVGERKLDEYEFG